MSFPEPPPKRRSKSAVSATLTLAIFAVASAISQPRAEARVWLDAAPEPVALALIHAAPVLAAVVALIADRLINRGKVGAKPVLIVAALFAVVGFVFASFLDIAGRVIDPSWFEGDLGWLEAAGFTIGAGFVAVGVLATIGVIVAPRGELPARDRRLHAVGAAIHLLEGATLIALTMVRILPEGSPGSLALVIFALAAGGAGIAVSAIIWRLMDEVERRATLDAYAISFFVGFYAALAWAGFEALGRAPDLTAFGVLVAASGLNFAAGVWTTLARFGRSVFA